MNTARTMTEMLRHASAAPLVAASPRRRAAILALAEAERLLPYLGWLLVKDGLVAEVSPTFAGYLSATGRWPSDSLEALAVTYGRNQQRTTDFRAQLVLLGDALDSAGVPWIPLKGTALLLDGVWPDPAAREMTDLDILIPDADRLDDATRVLGELGYADAPHELHPTRPVLDDTHQLRAMIHPDHQGSVELHRSLVPDEHLRHFPTAAALAGVRRTGSGLRLAPRDAVRHLIVHTRVSDWTLRNAVPAFRSILDVGYLLAAVPESVGEVVQVDDTPTVHRAIDGHLAAVDDLFGLDLPTSAAGRRWWWWAQFVASNRTRAWFVRNVRMLPVFLRRERMDARGGSPLRGVARLRFELGSTVGRIRLALRDRGGR